MRLLTLSFGRCLWLPDSISYIDKHTRDAMMILRSLGGGAAVRGAAPVASSLDAEEGPDGAGLSITLPKTVLLREG